MTRSTARGAPELLAAVDLGSNSFHMVVARYSHGQLLVMDRLREMGRGFRVETAIIPIVPGAIIFDLLNGGDKSWGEEPPYRRLGQAAAAAASSSAARRDQRARSRVLRMGGPAVGWMTTKLKTSQRPRPHGHGCLPLAAGRP